MRPFNLHSPVNQSIIFQIPKQNILNLRGLPLVKITISHISEDGSTDQLHVAKIVQHSPKDPEAQIQDDFS